VPKQLGDLNAMDQLRLGGNPGLAALPEEVDQLSTAHGGICDITM
jgi:hypothetical protein